MRIEWLCKKNAGRVIVFFNGWGMDAAAVSHLVTNSDVVMFYDYRTLECDVLPSLVKYKEVYIVAWSMGVWAAAHVVPLLGVIPTFSVALNGSERPVDDRYGIPCQVYALTEKGMNERGREKFFSRMLASREELTRFKEHKPDRDLGEQCEELVMVRKQSDWHKESISWTKIYIGNQDIIFPVKNLQNWWSGKAPITLLECGHYPFYCFRSWEEIIK